MEGGATETCVRPPRASDAEAIRMLETKLPHTDIYQKIHEELIVWPIVFGGRGSLGSFPAVRWTEDGATSILLEKA